MNLKKTASWIACGAAGLMALIIGLLVVGLGWRGVAQWRNAHSRAITSAEGIDELRKVRIGGVDQWIHIRGQNVANPILLYVHGGPGTPMMPFEGHFQTPLERDFTVVERDQRGAGMSDGGDAIAPTLTFDQMKADTHELAEERRPARRRAERLGRTHAAAGIEIVARPPQASRPERTTCNGTSCSS
jgi:pimeloyl-ACP methyl ester carboxylesterase